MYTGNCESPQIACGLRLGDPRFEVGLPPWKHLVRTDQLKITSEVSCSQNWPVGLDWWISWLGKELWQKPLFIQAARTYSSGEVVNQSYRRQVLLPDRGTENSPESVVSYCCSQYLHTAPTVENIANIKLKQLLIKRENWIILWQKLFIILL